MQGKQGMGPGQMNLNINPSTLDDLLCPNCDGNIFLPAVQFKLLPKIHLQNPTGQDVEIGINLIQCRNCGVIYQGPKNLKKIEKNPVILTNG